MGSPLISLFQFCLVYEDAAQNPALFDPEQSPNAVRAPQRSVPVSPVRSSKTSQPLPPQALHESMWGQSLLTMLDSFLVQVKVRGGFPAHTQVSVTSEPMSVVVGLGSTTMRGATGRERENENEPHSLERPEEGAHRGS